MSKAWIRAKRHEFGRDVLRDFCLSGKALEEAFASFEETGHVSFQTLLDLLGEPMNKGLLWRLKDTSHHLFRNEPQSEMVGRLLDWAMGYIFHETMKLKEDAYQQQAYAPWFRQLQGQDLGARERRYTQDLMQVLFQTKESMEREIRRIRFILQQCRLMFGAYLASHQDNPLLARLLFSQNILVRQVFRNDYDQLVSDIYGAEPEIMYALAARSLREGGWWEEASEAARQAGEINPSHPLVQAETKAMAEAGSNNISRRIRQ